MGSCNCYNPKIGGCAACTGGLGGVLPSWNPNSFQPYTPAPTTITVPNYNPLYDGRAEKLRAARYRVAMEMLLLADLMEESSLYDEEDDLRLHAGRLQGFLTKD